MNYMRQLDIIDPVLLAAEHVDLVGLGGIGSPTGYLLTKMGCLDLRAFDGDIVEEVNLSSQMYRLTDAQAGAPKALACQEIWQQFSGVKIEAVAERVTRQMLRGIVILGVDSMTARTVIWEQSIKDQPRVRWLIDARMGAETGSIFTIKPVLPADQRLYEASLYDDEDALPLPCTGRAVIYNTMWIAALIARQVKRLVLGQPHERRIDFDIGNLVLMVA